MPLYSPPQKAEIFDHKNFQTFSKEKYSPPFQFYFKLNGNRGVPDLV